MHLPRFPGTRPASKSLATLNPMSVQHLLDVAVAALNGKPRAGQIEMLKDVDKALETSRHLVIQAGTGTGKSLAYLVPAIRYAQEHEETVVVSTSTIALQRQLIHRDLPRLAQALAPHLPAEPTFAMMKGRGNYLCLRKLSAPESTELDTPTDLSELEMQAKRISEWSHITDTGDRDDLSPGVSYRVWSSFSSTAEECIGASKCPFGGQCFAEKAREKAKKVNIVVTNHALLAIDAMAEGAILPEHSVVIVDEAHDLEDRVTSLATESLSYTRLHTLSQQVSKALSPELAEDLEADSLSLLAELHNLPPGRITSLPPVLRKTLTALGATLTKLHLALLERTEEDVIISAENLQELPTEKSSQDNALILLERKTSNLCDVVKRLQDANGDVAWRDEDYALKVAPIQVSDLLSHTLFENNTVILTSATVALGGKFEAMAHRWGLKPGSWDSKDVGTPFDVFHSGILYIEKDLDNPPRGKKSPELLDTIEELITAAGGRTLGLFTSHAAAQEVAEEMRKRLPYTIYLQGEDSLANLVEWFSTDETSCLFGTLSLWQGVDVPGPALNLVIIDRIPFPRPDDPLIQARQEAAGRKGFMEVSLTHAALLLAQGAGRLLRSVTDKGVVAILDKRLGGGNSAKSYAQFLLKSLPEFWPDPRVHGGVYGAQKETVLKSLGSLANRGTADSADSSKQKTEQ